MKCDTPQLPEGFSVLSHGAAPWYNLSITINNGKEIVSSKLRFTYYIDPQMRAVNPAIGPLKGGTVSRILGEGFAQEGACNLTVRYGPIH